MLKSVTIRSFHTGYYLSYDTQVETGAYLMYLTRECKGFRSQWVVNSNIGNEPSYIQSGKFTLTNSNTYLGFDEKKLSTIDENKLHDTMTFSESYKKKQLFNFIKLESSFMDLYAIQATTDKTYGLFGPINEKPFTYFKELSRSGVFTSAEDLFVITDYPG